MYIEIYGCLFITKLYVQVELTNDGMRFSQNKNTSKSSQFILEFQIQQPSFHPSPFLLYLQVLILS